MSGWGLVNRPSYTVCGVSSHAVGDSEWGGASVRSALRQAADSDDKEVWKMNENPDGRTGGGAVRVTPEEAATLQSYPPAFNWKAIKPNGKPLTKGETFLIIGNSVPPLLVEAVLRAVWDEGGARVESQEEAA